MEGSWRGLSTRVRTVTPQCPGKDHQQSQLYSHLHMVSAHGFHTWALYIGSASCGPTCVPAHGPCMWPYMWPYMWALHMVPAYVPHPHPHACQCSHEGFQDSGVRAGTTLPCCNQVLLEAQAALLPQAGVPEHSRERQAGSYMDSGPHCPQPAKKTDAMSTLPGD